MLRCHHAVRAHDRRDEKAKRFSSAGLFLPLPSGALPQKVDLNSFLDRLRSTIINSTLNLSFLCKAPPGEGRVREVTFSTYC